MVDEMGSYTKVDEMDDDASVEAWVRNDLVEGGESGMDEADRDLAMCETGCLREGVFG